MRFSLIDADLFDYAADLKCSHIDHKHRIPVHCISADFAMAGGIAVPMATKYSLRSALSGYLVKSPTCLFVNNVMNLITKNKVWDLPTYSSLKESLEECKRLCENYNIRWLVMPKIGCGIDGLDWSTVKMIIKQVFNDTDIDILVCIPGMSKETK